MKLLPSTALLPLPPWDSLQLLAERGFNSVELNFYNLHLAGVDPYSMYGFYVRSFMAAAEAGVRVESVHLPWERYLAAFMGAGIERVARELALLIDLAAGYGVRSAVLHPLPAWVTGRGRVSWANRRLLTLLAREAAEKDVIIYVENLVEGEPWDSLASVAALVGDVDGVGLCIDVGHANVRGDDPAGLELRGPLCLHVHDNSGVRDEHLPPGCGGVDWEKWRRVAKLAGFVVVEAHCSLAPRLCLQRVAPALAAAGSLLGAG